MKIEVSGKMTRASRQTLAKVARYALIIFISSQLILFATAQSVAGTKQQQSPKPLNQPGTRLALSPSTQLRQRDQETDYQQQREEPANYVTPQSAPKRVTSQPKQATRNYDQQQQEVDHDGNSSNNLNRNSATTQDPLADSEPALYGSVAGAPGVDFPAYTRIPKTSFTCEGKGYDFGFYADEEAQCQVYHVCWSGRRESFLCGVGTVFNQAILTCDYWHSVDCSKSSQFYNANSELGKWIRSDTFNQLQFGPSN